MTYKLSQVTQAIDIDFHGNEVEIDGIHTLSDATPTQLSFFNDSKYASQLPTTQAAAVLIDAKHAPLLPSTTIALITDEAYLKLALASKLFAHTLVTQGEHPAMGEGCDIDKRVRFGKNVTLGDNVTILAGCYLGDNVTVGSGTLLHPNVTLYHHTQIGMECMIHSGTVIGSDGYGFAHTKAGEHIKIYQNGNAVIEDYVEIGANCTIDRAAFGSTVIGRGTKLDNLIQVAHNCILGENCLMASQSGVAGSSKLGRNVVIGGQTAVSGHLEVGDFATVGGKSGVTKSLKGGKTYAGVPAMEIKAWLRMQAKMARVLKDKK